MSYSYDRIETQQRRRNYGTSSRRTTLGYWVPLALSVTVATIGLAAWIWNERSSDDEYDRDDRDYRPPPNYGDGGPGQGPYPPQGQPIPPEDPGLMARMSGALRRTPSPQQFFDQAGRRVTAGVAAAGAAVTGAVGGALGSIREENKVDYEDHSRWSEEAAVRASSNIAASGPLAGPSSTFGVGAPQVPAAARSGDRRKTVAIVMSAENSHGDHSQDATYHQEHAVSSLSCF